MTIPPGDPVEHLRTGWFMGGSNHRLNLINPEQCVKAGGPLLFFSKSPSTLHLQNVEGTHDRHTSSMYYVYAELTCPSLC